MFFHCRPLSSMTWFSSKTDSSLGLNKVIRTSQSYMLPRCYLQKQSTFEEAPVD